MINRSDTLGIDSSANFHIDDRTIQDKLQYLYEYTAQIPFQVKPKVEFAEVSSCLHEDYSKDKATDGDTKTAWLTEYTPVGTTNWIEFTLDKPYPVISFEIYLAAPANGTMGIKGFDKNNREIFDKLLLDCCERSINGSFKLKEPIRGEPVKSVRFYDVTTEYSLVFGVMELIFDGVIESTWADVLFQGLSVTELAEQYQNPTGTLPPHQALLFAYLKMLETPQALMNRLPGKQRDLYYQELLGLKPQAAKPGQVAVSVQLEEAFSNLMVPKGSLLQAGQDENGIDIEYQLDRGVLANHSTFSALCLSSNSNYEPNPDDECCQYYDESDDDDKKNWPTNGIQLEKLNFFLGFKNLNQGDTLTLFFNLTATNNNPIEWFYFDEKKADNEKWQPLDSSLIDNTSDLSVSGTWSAVWPVSHQSELAWIKGEFTKTNIETSPGHYGPNPWYGAGDGDLGTIWHSHHTLIAFIEFTLPKPTDIGNMTVYSRNCKLIDRHMDGVIYHLIDEKGVELTNGTITDSMIMEGGIEVFKNAFPISLSSPVKGVKKIRLDKPNMADKWVLIAGIKLDGEFIRHDSAEVIGVNINGILTNATTATLSNASQLADTVTGQALPPESIKALATGIQGVEKIVQPWQSWGGEAPESHSDFNARIPRQLSHRDRAISYADSILLIKDNFAYVYDVIANQNDNSAINTAAFVVIPRARSRDNVDVYQPTLGRQKMDALRSFLTHRASAWTDVQVVNPKYNVVKLESTVTFKAGVNPEYGKAQLTESLIQHYMPWVSDRELGPKVANQFNYYDVIAHIQQHPLVDNLDELKLNNNSNSQSADSGEVLVLSTDSININEAN
ncbi:hypothetical protein [Vibrio sp. AND4]|uniref:hypothetical protein n=1 Tax=Vibrio sp. AND4 TaxID=314289 RepID=UPI00015F2BE1|nr:hypothetical protein [Vibrio sp. AND4]EDP57972.1 hypothetical protein AND4_05359 [Vibrio sp. AND4]